MSGELIIPDQLPALIAMVDPPPIVARFDDVAYLPSYPFLRIWFRHVFLLRSVFNRGFSPYFRYNLSLICPRLYRIFGTYLRFKNWAFCFHSYPDFAKEIDMVIAIHSKAEMTNAVMNLLDQVAKLSEWNS